MIRHVPRALLFASALLPLVALAGDAGAQKKVFTLNADFDPGSFNNSVDTNPNNQLVLGPTPVSKTHLVWATNYLYGWVVRFDSLTGKQTSRFDSSLQFINGLPTGAPPANEYCDFASTGNCPGRVAVDTNGDVWIINRAFGKQGSLSKFSGNLAHCIDRNNNGVIDTSFDANNDGLISVVNGAGEYFGQNDECILTTIKVGASNMYPRGVAVDKRGKIWASTHQDGKVYRFNPNEPVNLETTITVGGNPYSLATGKDYLFVSNSSASGTKRVHITTGAVQSVACPGTYGVVGDPLGDIAWLGGYFTGNGVYKANFANNACTNYTTATSVTAVTLDLQGNIWACGYNAAVVHKISPAGVILGTYPSGGRAHSDNRSGGSVHGNPGHRPRRQSSNSGATVTPAHAVPAAATHPRGARWARRPRRRSTGSRRTHPRASARGRRRACPRAPWCIRAGPGRARVRRPARAGTPAGRGRRGTAAAPRRRVQGAASCAPPPVRSRSQRGPITLA